MSNSKYFVEEEAKKHNVSLESMLYKYMVKKTAAVNRGSKARRSFGNLYALYSLCLEYLNGNREGSAFTHLMGIMKKLPYGSKLQNHPLDNRLNDEFSRAFDVDRSFLPVQNVESGQNRKVRRISTKLLSEYGMDPEKSAAFVVSVVKRYIEIISDKQTAYLDKIESASSKEQLIEVIREAFDYNSDARLFEIVSFALLHIHFYEQQVSISYNGNTTHTRLILHKTGRTNANDGGIDFVLKPLGEFFQVTETLDFKKYFLDFDKLNRFPLNFVIKTNLSSIQVKNKVQSDAEKNMDKDLVSTYMSLFNDIYTLNELNKILIHISTSDELLQKLTTIISESFKLEFGLLD